MRKIDIGIVILVVTNLLGACATAPRSPVMPSLHSTIAQGDKQLSAVSTETGVYAYSISGGPFSILVPNADARGNKYDAAHVPIWICASTDPVVFQDIAAGVNPQDTRCLNSGKQLGASLDQKTRGMNLLVSNGNWNNFIEGLGVPGPIYTTLNISRLLNLKRYNMKCVALHKQGCSQVTPVPFGSKIYVIVFVDMNGNNTIDRGEYTLLELDLAPPNS